jgi:hypothetical protein
MKNALGRFPTSEELWNAMNNGSLNAIDPPFAYRSAIGSACKDARHLHWTHLSRVHPKDRYNKLLQQWKSQPWWYRIWNLDQKPVYREVSPRIQEAHRKESINNFKNAIKRVMTTVPALGVPLTGYQLLNNTEE